MKKNLYEHSLFWPDKTCWILAFLCHLLLGLSSWHLVFMLKHRHCGAEPSRSAPSFSGDRAPKGMIPLVPPLTFCGRAHGGQRAMTPKLRCLQYKGCHQPMLPQWGKKKKRWVSSLTWFFSTVLAASVTPRCILPFPCLFLPADYKMSPGRLTSSYAYMKS